MGLFRRPLKKQHRAALRKASGNGGERRVRDASYWGVPEGTPISQAKKIRQAKGLSATPGRSGGGTPKPKADPDVRRGRGIDTRPKADPVGKVDESSVGRRGTDASRVSRVVKDRANAPSGVLERTAKGLPKGSRERKLIEAELAGRKGENTAANNARRQAGQMTPAPAKRKRRLSDLEAYEKRVGLAPIGETNHEDAQLGAARERTAAGRRSSGAPRQKPSESASAGWAKTMSDSELDFAVKKDRRVVNDPDASAAERKAARTRVAQAQAEKARRGR